MEAVKSIGGATIGGLMANPFFLIALAIGLIIMVVTGLVFIIFMPHYLVAGALFIFAIVIFRSPFIKDIRLKLLIVFILIIVAILALTNPGLVGMVMLT